MLLGLEINMTLPNADPVPWIRELPRLHLAYKDIFRPKKFWKLACPELWEGLGKELKLQNLGQRWEVPTLAE